MKKRQNTKYILPITLLCLLLFTMKVSASDVYLDADAVRQKTATKSSLIDVNGVFVFRDEFIERERIVKQEEKQRLEDIEYTVLLSVGQTLDYGEIVNVVLLSDTEKYIGDIYNIQTTSNLRWWVYSGTAGICLLCLAVRIQDMRKKKMKTEQKEDIYDGKYNDI